MEGKASGLTNGLQLRAARCRVQNIAIGNFPGTAIHVHGLLAHDNWIQNCYVGTDASGKTIAPNKSNGIAIGEGATGTHIVNNVISGNKYCGLTVSGWFY